MPTSLTSPTTDTDRTDARPRFGIGHLSMTATDVSALTAFYGRIGMRVVVDTDGFAILELRGGTHLILQPGPAGQGTLDLIVGDIDDTHRVLDEAGGRPGRITRGFPHDRFTARDPEDNVLFVNSDHSIGPV